MRAVRAHEQGMAVRHRARHLGCRDCAVCARLVLDDDGRLERDAERGSNNSGDHVGAAAGTERNDDGDGFAWIVLVVSLDGSLDISLSASFVSLRMRGDREQRCTSSNENAKRTFHQRFLSVLFVAPIQLSKGGAAKPTLLNDTPNREWSISVGGAPAIVGCSEIGFIAQSDCAVLPSQVLPSQVLHLQGRMDNSLASPWRGRCPRTSRSAHRK